MAFALTGMLKMPEVETGVVMLTSKTWAVNDAWAPVHQFPAFPDSGIKEISHCKVA